jgi:transcriptional regulator with XRE-family HTH domain
VTSTASASQQRPTPVGTLLACARRDVGLSQVAVVGKTTLSQAQLSRIEHGQSMPTLSQARELAALYRLDTDARRQVIQAATDHKAGRSDSRLVIQRGTILSLQQRFRRIEEQAASVRAFSPAMVLGQLQTPAYAAAVFNQPEDSEVVQDRVRRAVHAPYNHGRTYTLILTEGSLRWAFRSPAVMAEQLDHLITTSELAHVRLGLIDSRTFVEVGPGPGFYLYDDHTVVLSEVGGYALLRNRADLTEYRSTFEHFERLATFGTPTRDRLREIADDYRRQNLL